MKITLTYFKPTGKYYSGGSFEVPDAQEHHFTIAMVRNMLGLRMLPGLVNNHSYYHVLVTGSDFVPTLVLEPDLDE